MHLFSNSKTVYYKEVVSMITFLGWRGEALDSQQELDIWMWKDVHLHEWFWRSYNPLYDDYTPFL